MNNLKLEKILPHQQKAITALTTVFDEAHYELPVFGYDNPHLSITDQELGNALTRARINVFPEWQTFASANDETHCLYLDVKMETGTGKTYVYTNLMYELFEKYSLSKFIILVPSLPVKAGTKQFITDPYTQYHFAQECDCHYRGILDSYILEAKAKKKGRQYFPSAVTEFVCANTRSTNHISVLLANMQLLTNTDMMKRSDYGSDINGFYRPFDALRAVRPVVIIDEPHRFDSEQKAWQVIINELKPQCVVRFGATFPEKVAGKGKNAKKIKDYRNLVYNLDACESFNSGLVKEITKEHFVCPTRIPEKVKLISVDGKKKAHFQLISESDTKSNKTSTVQKKTFTLQKDDCLSVISAGFGNLKIDGIGKNYNLLSNGVQKNINDPFAIDTYTTSYQEGMVELALQRHFETERQNFNQQPKIKTLALFFIDDIPSYRGKTSAGDEVEPYLKEMFERLLKAHVKKLLKELLPEENAYAAYLNATLEDIGKCHAGYFSQDNADSDEDIAEEVQDILVNKKKLLSIKNEDGFLNTRSFLFSKWTLKEGWDNPNVFTITKLRSSGSDISKIQEVGRGLRLPVDENGNRVSSRAFMLNYIVDFTEADFADKLVKEINGDRPEALSLSKEDIIRVAAQKQIDERKLTLTLFQKNYIDYQQITTTDGKILYPIIAESIEQFFSEYPEFNSAAVKLLNANKVIDANKKKPVEVHIRKDSYDELKKLWLAINKRYAIIYDEKLDDSIHESLPFIIADDVFSKAIIHSVREHVKTTEKMAVAEAECGTEIEISRPIPYGEFLNRAVQRTNIPADKIHDSICAYSQKLKKEKNAGLTDDDFNEQSLERFVSKIQDWKINNYEGRYQYKKVSSAKTKPSALNYSDGMPKQTVSVGRIGTIIEPGAPAKEYLYDIIAYDSPLEGVDIKSRDVDSVVVYGKIPRKSIAIPTVTGETYSPDFMYVVRKTDGSKELNLIVETKDVRTEEDLRGIEKAKIKCAEVFFENLKNEGLNVVFKKQLSSTAMKTIIQNAIIT